MCGAWFWIKNRYTGNLGYKHILVTGNGEVSDEPCGSYAMFCVCLADKNSCPCCILGMATASP